MDEKNVDIDDHNSWPKAIKSHFISLLYEEAKKGLQTTTLDKKGWLKIENDILNSFGKRYKMPQLKSKFNRLRKAHREFSHLLEQIGMGWDPQTNTVTTNDEVWDTYLKKYPNAKRFRKKGLQHYEMLGEIFNNTTATGGMSYASTQIPPSSVEERQQERHFVGTGAHVDVGFEFDGDNYGEEGEVTSVRRRATFAPPDAPKPKEKKNKGANPSIDHVMEELAKSISAKTEASLVRSETMCKYYESRERRISEEISNVTNSYNVEDCQNILDGIPNLDNKIYLKALQEFVATPEWRGIFMRMNEERRRAYLDSLMG
ncbi:L10-interacting MYB domain-containing protein-like [Humulus lupulus]|uniref:L10-interacting MYB domain-containing protein-like n=1 Tax=Humulus lupulus TaxID=3486 RepID=UPI002B406ABB|nr:L10-interacting MYB domain-containing protein-like [Humulus lupulus]